MEAFTNCQGCDQDLSEDEAYPTGEDYICGICLEKDLDESNRMARYYA